ncbi:probable clathrin assembly protein At4g32285 [Rutidosis leptorrhynchoides]|uniref:probable clathrin assembly protein At4g32285 n=1 Tax=Rutidosis leptorrhynchoides TaxID=125765 RepID=UPI003A998FC5
MASSTIRKAIGVVKDQTSISIAKVAGNVAPDLEVLIVKATGHDNEPAEEKYIREILNYTSCSRSYVSACVYTLFKRLSKTRDWVVALKALMLVHRLLVDGDFAICQEIMGASRKGTRVLNMSEFHDEAHSNSWDHSGFVKSYALFLDQKLKLIAFEQNVSEVDDRCEFRSRSYGDLYELKRIDIKDVKVVKQVKEMSNEKVLERLNHLLSVLDRVLSCRPTGNAKNSRMVLIVLQIVLKESFGVYGDMCEALAVLFDRFSEFEYDFGVKAFDEYVYAAKMSDELVGFYTVCKDLGVARSYEFPKVKSISDELLGGLEKVLREKKNVSNNEKNREIVKLDDVSETLTNMNEIKALPPPESHKSPPRTAVPVPQPPTEDLLNLKDDAMSADAHGNKLPISLFSAPQNMNPNGSWEVLSSNVADDWEVALVESASNLSKQKADMAGGLDSLVLNGMYDQGVVRQHVNNDQLSGGSSSSVVMPGLARNGTSILALPAPDGTLQSVGPQDPFAASLAIPPPAYVQIADMEKKQNLLLQEQHVWQQYGSNGMQGQGALMRITAGVAGYNGLGQQAGYYYA